MILFQLVVIALFNKAFLATIVMWDKTPVCSARTWFKNMDV